MKKFTTHRKALTFIIPGLALAFGSGSVASTVLPGGTVHFMGTVVDSPCVVSTADTNQEINLGQAKLTSFSAAGDKSQPVGFNITLEQCDTSSIQTASFMFSGQVDTDSVSTLSNVATDGASGIGVQLADKLGNVIPLDNTASIATYQLADGTNVANFSAYMIDTGSDNGVTAGNVDATATFAISYE